MILNLQSAEGINSSNMMQYVTIRPRNLGESPTSPLA